jgi:hypothetical protein
VSRTTAIKGESSGNAQNVIAMRWNSRKTLIAARLAVRGSLRLTPHRKRSRFGNCNRGEVLHEQTKNNLGTATAKHVLNREGAALSFDTLVDGGTEQDRYTLMDRWKLTREGQRLLIHREFVRRRGEVEADLVYDRQ